MLLKLQKLLFFLALLGIAFSYGFISSWKQIFPYTVISEARIAFQAVIELFITPEEDISGVDFMDQSGTTSPRSTILSPDVGDEKLFVLGNEQAYLNLGLEAGALAWIMDREGNILHIWKNKLNLWAPLQKRKAIKKTWYAYPVGAFLFPNGDILVSYQGRNTFPMPMGLAKFDKDSNLIWKRDDYHHHWFSVADDGKIFVPTAKIVSSPLRINDMDKYFTCKKKKFTLESIAILDSDGDLIREIDIFKALIQSDLVGVFNNNGRHAYNIESCDPLHLNDIRILPKTIATHFPHFKAGDLLLSFRSLNAVGVLDPDTSLFKWFHVGAVDNQHSPRFYKDNRIIIFDNLGGRRSTGVSRVAEIDISTGQGRTLFPQSNTKVPSKDLFSKTAGHIDVHPNKKRMLVSWTHQGKVLEIKIESGEVLWEYINTHQIEDSFRRLPVYTILYINSKLYFPLNKGKIP